jgi:hypothetical protein
MKPRPTNGYIWIGAGVRFLVDANSTTPVFPEEYIVPTIGIVLRYLDEYELLVTRRVAKQLEAMRDGWLIELSASSDSEALKSTRRMTAFEATRLRQSALDVSTTLQAESEGQIIFVTTPKRFDMSRLLGEVGALMAPGVYDALPDIARHDFAEAGKCIAYELPTAAGFHLLRGTEDVLRWYYCSTVKRGRIDPLMWFSMTAHLSKRRAPPPAVLLANLDNLRKSFRNPTQHPEMIYDIEEVQDLFALSIEVVSRMVRQVGIVS